jgi:hypothetical protein
MSVARTLRLRALALRLVAALACVALLVVGGAAGAQHAQPGTKKG